MKFDTEELVSLDYFMYVNILPPCICIPHVCLVPKEVRKSVEFPGTGVMDKCEPLCGCWELNLGLPQEQPVLLTTNPLYILC